MTGLSTFYEMNEAKQHNLICRFSLSYINSAANITNNKNVNLSWKLGE